MGGHRPDGARIAELGHHVHVLTAAEGHDRIDFEAGVWVHRVAPRPAPPNPGLPIPPHIWTHACTVLSALRDVAARHRITAVYAPIWNCEGIAICLDGSFPLVLGLQTTLRFWLDSHPHIAADQAFQRDFAAPMLALEARLLRDSDAVHAISASIACDISRAYEVPLDPPRTMVRPLGLDDWSLLPAAAPTALPDGALRLLFVGRLEARKGIDVLFDILAGLLARHPRLHATLSATTGSLDRMAGPTGPPSKHRRQPGCWRAWGSTAKCRKLGCAASIGPATYSSPPAALNPLASSWWRR